MFGDPLAFGSWTIARVAGVRLRVHAILPLASAVLVLARLLAALAGSPDGLRLEPVLVLGAATLAGALAMGSGALAARLLLGPGHALTLVPWGAVLTFADTAAHPRRRLAVIGLVAITLGALAQGLWALGLRGFSRTVLALLIGFTIPIWPLGGAHALLAVLQVRCRSLARAGRDTLFVSRFVAGGLMLLAIAQDDVVAVLSLAALWVLAHAGLGGPLFVPPLVQRGCQTVVNFFRRRAAPAVGLLLALLCVTALIVRWAGAGS